MANIIPQIKQVLNSDNWLLQLANATTNPKELLNQLQLDPKLLTYSAEIAKKQFPLRVPQAFVNRMKKGDAKDPLLLQVLHNEKELIQTTGFSHDPLEEQHNSCIQFIT